MPERIIVVVHTISMQFRTVFTADEILGLYNKGWVSKGVCIFKQTQKLPTKKSGVKLNLYKLKKN